MFDLGRSFLAAVERRPWAIAIADGDIHKRYDTWFEDIQSVARALEGFGLRKGDRLLVVMQNRWQMATLHWACQFAGIIITPVNWRSTAQDLAFLFRIRAPGCWCMTAQQGGGGQLCRGPGDDSYCGG